MPQDIDAIVIDDDINEVARVLVAAPDVDGPIQRYNVIPSGLVARIDVRSAPAEGRLFGNGGKAIAANQS